jgi:hypothetical protein
MSEGLSKKLRYKQGRATVINAPKGYSLDIDTENTLEGTFDFVQVFVLNAEEVTEWLPKVILSLNDDAVFWICYPKQSSKIKTDINRDIIWRMVLDMSDYRLVSNVSIDETWSALRCRHQDKVKTKS